VVMSQISAALPNFIHFMADIKSVGDGGSMKMLLSTTELCEESTTTGSKVIVGLFNRASNHSF